MLTSRNARFLFWNKQDWAAEIPFFRSRAQHWHPTVRRPEVDDDDNPRRSNRRGVTPAKNRPVWNPWLWIE